MKAPTRVIPLAAACALCLTSGLVGGLSVAMMGMGQQPDSQAEPTPFAKSLKTMMDFHKTSVESTVAEAKRRDGFPHPIVASAPKGGCFLVITGSGMSYLISDDGRMTHPILVDGGKLYQSDLWLGHDLSATDFIRAASEAARTEAPKP